MFIRTLVIAAGLLASVCSLNLHAGDYTPEGLYDVSRYKFDNGFEVYLRERHEAKSTSIRLLVNYGANDNDCGKIETAHYLEHLLFTGTSKHSEEELDNLIEDNGGSWNAFTYDEKTSYEIDIYSPYTELAINTLFEIITDSTLTEDNVLTTKDIIKRETGGEYSWLSKYLYDFDIGKTGYDKANILLYAKDEYCPSIEDTENISRNDILEALDKFYVPNNMALIMVGNFDTRQVLETIKQSFGTMHKTTIDHVRPSGIHDYISTDIFTGTLNPLRGNNASVAIRYRIPGYANSNEQLIFTLLSIYLSNDLYNRIRVERGLSYNVEAAAVYGQNYGLLELYADSEIENMQTITDLMLEEIDKLINEPIPQEKFDRVKRGLLLNYVYAFQDNSSIADFYSGLWRDMMTIDRFIRPDEVIEEITPDDFKRIAQKYLSRKKAVISHDAPTLSYEQTYMLIGILILLLVYAVKKRISSIRP